MAPIRGSRMRVTRGRRLIGRSMRHADEERWPRRLRGCLFEGRQIATPDDVIGIQDVAYHGWLATYANAEHGITAADIEDRYKDRHNEERIARGESSWPILPMSRPHLIAREGGKVCWLCRAIKHPDCNQIYASTAYRNITVVALVPRYGKKRRSISIRTSIASSKLPSTIPRSPDAMDDSD
jgi:hypothetical protein